MNITFLTIVEWSIWVLLFIATLLLSLGHYNRAVKQGSSFHKATPIIIFIGWTLVLIFIFTNISKFHIIWLYPIGIFITWFWVTQKAIHDAKKEFNHFKKKKKTNLKNE